MTDGKATHYDENKLRLDLVPVPVRAQRDYAQVYTFGAKKYEENQWRKGMKWSKVYGSLLRHLNAFISGENFDPESGLPHTAHIMCNAAFLNEYLYTNVEDDDRIYHRTIKKVGFPSDRYNKDIVSETSNYIIKCIQTSSSMDEFIIEIQKSNVDIYIDTHTNRIRELLYIGVPFKIGLLSHDEKCDIQGLRGLHGLQGIYQGSSIDDILEKML